MEQDRKAFQFNDFGSTDILSYLRGALLGAKRYLLFEKDENIPRASKKYERILLADRIIKLIFFTFLAYYALVKYGDYIGFTHYSDLPTVCL